MIEDQQIWERFKSGDKTATSHIYYTHIRVLYRYGKKFTTDEELVKDTIQELFFDLIRTRENLGLTDNIRFYLVKSFRRRILHALQKKPFPVETDQSIESSPLTITYSYEEELINKENLSRRDELVQKALKAISPKQREILFYRFTCDFKYDQICEIMEIQYDSARKMVFRALKSLKEYLSETDLVFFIHFQKIISFLKK
jgi:RNA polymerase sigma factor (sigma-70 family)